jgi:hypothetical protein
MTGTESAMDNPLRFHYRPEDTTKLRIRYLLIHAGTGLLDSDKVIFIGEQRRMQRPLRATPGSSAMDGAAILVKDTMTVDNFHLGDITGHPPIFFPHLFFTQTQGRNHAPPVILVKGDGRFTLAAIAAALTLKYLFHLIHFYPAGPFGPLMCNFYANDQAFPTTSP